MRLYITEAIAAVIEVARVQRDASARGGTTPPVTSKGLVEKFLPGKGRALETYLQQLGQEGILTSVRGPRGGYFLGRAPEKISLADIEAAVATGGAEGSPASQNATAIEAQRAVLDADNTRSAFLDRIRVSDILARIPAESPNSGVKKAA